MGYIYIRSNEYWDLYNAFKLGKTLNIPDREQTYITSEIKRGVYIIVIEIDSSILDNIERQLQTYFTSLNLHIKFNAGIEFYKKEIINLIIPFLNTNYINYKILSNDDIDCLIRKSRHYDNLDNNEDLDNSDDLDNINNCCNDDLDNINDYCNENNDNENNNYYNSLERYKPRDYQEIIINNSNKYFKTNDKGLLIIPCGVGKTLISLWITQSLNCKTILIGVPNTLLLKQWEKNICSLFTNIPYLIVFSGITIENIINFLEINTNNCIVITSYSSAHKVFEATQQKQFIFNMKINDECHHLATANMQLENTTKRYIQMLNILSDKQLSLTATMKQIENMYDNNAIISNDNIEYFGEIIDRKCLLWAINHKIICDYIIQTIITNEENLEQQLLLFNVTEENDKRLFLSGFASLKSINEGHSHHLLIYSNNKVNSLKLIQYIRILLDNKYFNIPDLYYSSYHSEMSSKEQKEIISNFDKAKFGIITCVYCLGEGWDFPLLDAVVFAENMTSNIRIVQSALRASRKNKQEPDKITKIILPILNRDDWLENTENSDLKKVREVIYQMGLEDETINQKIKVLKINIEKSSQQVSKEIQKNTYNDFGEYDDELTNKLKLKLIKRTSLGITYEKARKIISSKNIDSKESYNELCEMDNRLPKEPEIFFKGQFTNWIDYLSIERKYYDLETCKNKIAEYLLEHPEMKRYYLELSIISAELCKIDDMFPPKGLWVEYYDVKDLRDIISIGNKKKKIGAIL